MLLLLLTSCKSLMVKAIAQEVGDLGCSMRIQAHSSHLPTRQEAELYWRGGSLHSLLETMLLCREQCETLGDKKRRYKQRWDLAV